MRSLSIVKPPPRVPAMKKSRSTSLKAYWKRVRAEMRDDPRADLSRARFVVKQLLNNEKRPWLATAK